MDCFGHLCLLPGLGLRPHEPTKLLCPHLPPFPVLHLLRLHRCAGRRCRHLYVCLQSLRRSIINRDKTPFLLFDPMFLSVVGTGYDCDGRVVWAIVVGCISAVLVIIQILLSHFAYNIAQVRCGERGAKRDVCGQCRG